MEFHYSIIKIGRTAMCFLLFVFCFYFSVAQNLNLRKWDTFKPSGYIDPEDMIQDNEGYLWVTSSTLGLMRFDGQSIVYFSKNTNDPRSVPSNHLTSIDTFKNSLIIGTKGGGWSILDKNTYLFQNFDQKHYPQMKSDVIEDVFFYKNKIYIGSHRGLCIYDINSQSLECHQFTEVINLETEYENIIMAIAADPDDEDLLWLGTTQGLKKWSISKQEMTKIPMPESILNTSVITPSGNPYQIQIRDIIFDDEVLWFSTWGGGIISYDKKSDTWNRFDYTPGKRKLPEALSFNSGNELYHYNDDTLLLASFYDVQVFDKKTFKFSPLNLFDQFRSQDAGRLFFSFHKMQDGRLVIGNENVLLEQPSKLPLKYEDLKINHLIVNDKVLIDRWRIAEGNISLSDGSHNITINISHPSFGKVDTLYYKLAKGMPKWQSFHSNEIILTGINHSNQLYISTRPEIKNAETLVFTISKKWYKRIWFYTIMSIMLFGSIFLYFFLKYRERLRTRAIEERYLKKLSEMEMQTLRAQMNPHFLFNSLNAIKHYSLTKSPFETSDYISKFSLLIRRILNNSEHKVLPLGEEIETLKLYVEVESLRFLNKFNYAFEIDDSIDLNEIMVPPLILQPFVENAIWHGLMHLPNEGQLLIQIKDRGDIIRCVISDNGVGRKVAKEIAAQKNKGKKSFGIQNTKNRIDLVEKLYGIKATFQIKDNYDGSGNATGTTVTVDIPKLKDQ